MRINADICKSNIGENHGFKPNVSSETKVPPLLSELFTFSLFGVHFDQNTDILV